MVNNGYKTVTIYIIWVIILIVPEMYGNGLVLSDILKYDINIQQVESFIGKDGYVIKAVGYDIV